MPIARPIARAPLTHTLMSQDSTPLENADLQVIGATTRVQTKMRRRGASRETKARAPFPGIFYEERQGILLSLSLPLPEKIFA